MKTFLSLLIVTLAEATIGIFVKLSDEQIPIMTLNFYRVFFATIFLGVAMMFINKNFWKFPKKNIKDILIIGALIAVQISSFNLAMRLTTVANAVIFWSIAPFFVFIFSWLFLRERPKRQYIFIFLLALVGLFIAEPFGGGNASGNAIALITGVVYAGAVTYMRHEGKTETGNDVFWFMLVASLFLLPSIFIFGAGDLLVNSSSTLFGTTVPRLLWVVSLGIISTGVAYLFISIVLKKINANVYSLVDIIVSPIVAAVLAYFVFGEVPSNNVVIGGALLLASGLWLTRGMSTSRKDY